MSPPNADTKAETLRREKINWPEKVIKHSSLLHQVCRLSSAAFPSMLHIVVNLSFMRLRWEKKTARKWSRHLNRMAFFTEKATTSPMNEKCWKADPRRWESLTAWPIDGSFAASIMQSTTSKKKKVTQLNCCLIIDAENLYSAFKCGPMKPFWRWLQIGLRKEQEKRTHTHTLTHRSCSLWLEWSADDGNACK